MILCGVVWGLWVGFAIVCAGMCYYTFKVDPLGLCFLFHFSRSRALATTLFTHTQSPRIPLLPSFVTSVVPSLSPGDRHLPRRNGQLLRLQILAPGKGGQARADEYELCVTCARRARGRVEDCGHVAVERCPRVSLACALSGMGTDVGEG